MRYEVENMREIPAAACVARFWAQPPKYDNFGVPSGEVSCRDIAESGVGVSVIA